MTRWHTPQRPRRRHRRVRGTLLTDSVARPERVEMSKASQTAARFGLRSAPGFLPGFFGADRDLIIPLPKGGLACRAVQQTCHRSPRHMPPYSVHQHSIVLGSPGPSAFATVTPLLRFNRCFHTAILPRDAADSIALFLPQPRICDFSSPHVVNPGGESGSPPQTRGTPAFYGPW